jgi:hypothetical protein
MLPFLPHFAQVDSKEMGPTLMENEGDSIEKTTANLENSFNR